eukprot:TRINITY_DN15489_c0_g1_i1.p1 TRINITY_DN15489_c0_g1~~TRINITY_DN15489_c0_g1_i1.p1  ORF type:complete len:365 (+),score=50.40 TRINITY_DN15489_c0_g1_i1:49-1143(+)
MGYPYNVEAWLRGRGGYGAVYRVRRTKDHVQFVMRVQELAEEEEAKRAVAELKNAVAHRWVTPVVDQFVVMGVNGLYEHHILMPLLEGDLVDFRDKRAAAVAKDEVRTMLEHISSALAHLHKNGVHHCDVNPFNISYEYTPPGNLNFFLTNLGCKKDPAQPGGPFTPPEGHATPPPAFDAWGLGVTAAWVMLTEPEQTKLLKTLHTDYKTSRGKIQATAQERMGKQLASIVMRLLVKDEKRCRVSEIVTALGMEGSCAEDRKHCESCGRPAQYRCALCTDWDGGVVDLTVYLCSYENCFDATHNKPLMYHKGHLVPWDCPKTLKSIPTGPLYPFPQPVDDVRGSSMRQLVESLLASAAPTGCTR